MIISIQGAYPNTRGWSKPGYQRAKEQRDEVYIVFGDDENSIVGDEERFTIIIIIQYLLCTCIYYIGHH